MTKAIENTDLDDEQEFVDELAPGTTLLHGQYTIESFLNSGGFGITYLANDSLGRQVVIKECFPGALCRRGQSRVRARSRAHQAEFQAVVGRFVQEAKSLAKLKHPNIVGVHQVFEDNETAYMALDYIDGFDLLESIEDGTGNFKPETIIKTLRKILGAVEFIHQHNVLHRDISPDNILIEQKTGEPLLIDFGAAREDASDDNRVLSALLVVKDGYSPQEFYIKGSKQTPSSDLYALAASFSHLISGEAIPDSQTRLAALAQEQDDPYVHLATNSKLQDDYDVTFLSAIDKALNVFPKDRIQSAEEWLEMISSGVSELKTKTAQSTPESEDPEEKATKEADLKKIEAEEADLKKIIVSEPESAPAPQKSKGLLITVSVIALAVGIGIAFWQMGGSDTPSGSVGETGNEITTAPPVVSPSVETTDDTAALPLEASETVTTEATDDAQPENDVEVAVAINTTDEAQPETAELPKINETIQPDLPEGVELIAPLVVTDEPVIAVPDTANEEVIAQPEGGVEIAGTTTEEQSALQNPDKLILPEGVELITPAAPTDSAEIETPTVAIDDNLPAVEEIDAVDTEDMAQPVGDVEIAGITDATTTEEQSTLQNPDKLILPEGVELITPATPAVNLESIPEIKFTPKVLLPFSNTINSQVTIANLDSNAPKWMRVGQRIVAVNGQEIQSFEQINPILQDLVDLQNTDTVEVAFSVEAFPGSVAIQRTVTLEVVSDFELPSGLTFRVQTADEGQKNTLVVASPKSQSGLMVGDIVVGDMDTGERIDVDISLKEVLLREAAKGVVNFNLLIIRNGEQWVTPFYLKDG